MEFQSIYLAMYFTTVLNTIPEWKSKALGHLGFISVLIDINFILFSYFLIHYIEQNSVNASACDKGLLL